MIKLHIFGHTISVILILEANFMKKLFTVALALVLTFSMAACGCQAQDKTPATTAPTTVPTTAPTTTPTTAPTMPMDPTVETNIPDPSVDPSMPDNGSASEESGNNGSGENGNGGSNGGQSGNGGATGETGMDNRMIRR